MSAPGCVTLSQGLVHRHYDENFNLTSTWEPIWHPPETLMSSWLYAALPWRGLLCSLPKWWLIFPGRTILDCASIGGELVRSSLCARVETFICVSTVIVSIGKSGFVGRLRFWFYYQLFGWRQSPWNTPFSSCTIPRKHFSFSFIKVFWILYWFLWKLFFE